MNETRACLQFQLAVDEAYESSLVVSPSSEAKRLSAQRNGSQPSSCFAEVLEWMHHRLTAQTKATAD